MREISHREAQALLQKATDQTLDPSKKSALEAHLAICEECCAYANNLHTLEINLRKVFHTQWDAQRPKIDSNAILDSVHRKFLWNVHYLQPNVISKVSIVATFLLGFIFIFNLLAKDLLSVERSTPTTIPTPSEFSSSLFVSPTPSTHVTSTNLASYPCEDVQYIVKSSDTLASIALEFGITQKSLMEHNNLKADSLPPEKELSIPLCKITPAHTTYTTTITPLIETVIPVQPE